MVVDIKPLLPMAPAAGSEGRNSSSLLDLVFACNTRQFHRLSQS